MSTKESSQAKYDEVLANIADKVEIFICDWLENIDDYEKKSASLNSTWAEKMLENIQEIQLEIFTAKNLFEGVELIKTEQPQLVFLDHLIVFLLGKLTLYYY